MVDVARLQIEADSRQVKTAQERLDGLSTSGRRAAGETDRFGRRVDGANRSSQNLSSSLGNLKGILATLGLSAAAASMLRFANSAINAADNIEIIANTASVSASSLQELRFAFGQLAGTTNRDVDSALRRFNRRLGLAADGSGAAKDTFENLSIALETAGGKTRTTEKVLDDLINQLGGIESDSRRAALASQAFGEDAGPRLAAAIGEGTGAINELRDAAVVLEDDLVATGARIGDELDQIFGDIQTEFQRAFLGNLQENEQAYREFIATVIRGAATLVDYSDEIAGAAGGGILGRIFFGKKGYGLGAAVATSLDNVQSLLDRFAEEALSLTEILGLDTQEFVKEQQKLREETDKTADSQNKLTDAMRQFADDFESGQKAVNDQIITAGEELTHVDLRVNELSDSMKELLGIRFEIPGEIAGRDFGERFSSAFKDELEKASQDIAATLGSALVTGDTEAAFQDIAGQLAQSAGTAIGTAIGGPAGAAVGSFAGSAFGALVDKAFGGSTYDLEAVQSQQSTGTVLGDINAKSDSIDSSLKEIQSATDEIVNINSGMLRSLQQVQNGIARASGRVAQDQAGQRFSVGGPSNGEQALGEIQATSLGLVGAGLLSFNPITAVAGIANEILGGPLDDLLEGIAGTIDDIFGGVFSSIGGSIFGGGKSIVDKGINVVGGEITDLLDDVMVRSFARIKEDGGWFSSDDYSTKLRSLPQTTENQFRAVFRDITDSVTEGAEALGVLPQRVQRRLDRFVVRSRKISLKGMSGEEQTQAIEDMFSNIFDRLASSIVPFAKDFQRAGEGVGETIARLASQVGIFEEVALSLGQSLEGITGRSRSAAAIDLAEGLGGTEQLARALTGFESNFFDTATQVEVSGRRLSEALGDLPLPETREGFLDLARSQNIQTQEGRENVETLLRLQGTADQYYSSLDKLNDAQKSADEIAREREGLERQLLQLQGNTSEIRKLELESLDESNRELQRRIFNLQDEKKITQEREGLERQLLQVQGDTQAIRQLEIDALDESNQSIQRRIYNLQDEQEAQRKLEQAQSSRTDFLRRDESPESLIARINDDLGTSISSQSGLDAFVNSLDLTKESAREALNQASPLAQALNQVADAEARAQQEEQRRIEQINQERQGLNRELLELQGKTAEIRQLEIQSLDKSNRELQRRIFALQDEQEEQRRLDQIQQEREGLERQLLQVQDDTQALRQLELDSLDESNRALQKRVFSLQDEKEAQQALEQAKSSRTDFLRRDESAESIIDRLNNRLGISAESQSGVNAFVRSLDLTTEAGRNALEQARPLAQALQRVADAEAQAQQEEQRRLEQIQQERQGLNRELLNLQGKTEQIRQLEIESLNESNRGLQRRIYNLQDEQEEQRRLEQIQQERQGLNRELLNLQGKTEQIRQLEIESLNESNRRLQRRIYNLQDEQEEQRRLEKIQQEREGLERRLLELQGDTESIRRLEIDALDESNQSIQRRIFALQDENEARDAAFTSINDILSSIRSARGDLGDSINRREGELNTRQGELGSSVEKAREQLEQARQRAQSEQVDSLNDSASAARDTASAFSSLVETISDTRQQLLMGSTASPEQSSRNAFNQSLQAVFRGDTEAAQGIGQQAQSLAEQVRAQSSTGVEARLGVADIRSQLASAQDVAETRLSRAERQVRAAEQQLESLESTEEEVLSISQAQSALAEAQAKRDNANIDSQLRQLEQLRDQYDLSDDQLSVQQALRGLELEKRDFNREWRSSQELLLSEQSDRLSELRTAISDLGLNGGPEMASGGVVSGPASGFPATLHGTEAVIPMNNGASIPVNVNNDELVAEIRALRKEMQTMGSQQTEQSKKTAKILRKFDIDGLPETRSA